MGKIPAQSLDTTQFIKKVDQLFDTFNSSKINSNDLKEYKRPLKTGSVHFEFLEEMLQVFKDLNVVDKTKILWQLSISAMLELWKSLEIDFFEVKLELDYIMTRTLQQKCLKFFFHCKSIRGKILQKRPLTILKKFFIGL